jgi:hypothetical protein
MSELLRRGDGMVSAWSVVLYHSTDEAGKIGIETEGFGLSHMAEFP